jgi:segregation and condensation protein B
MDTDFLKKVLEVALLSSDRPLNLSDMSRLFDDPVSETDLLKTLSHLQQDYALSWIELKEVAGGYRLQTKPEALSYLIRLKQEKPPKYSRAIMETLAIIVWRQPVTRGDIEEIRGVTVASQVIKTLEERGWIEGVGYREVPGRPMLYATTDQFLSDFGLKSLVDLPVLSPILGEQESLPWADSGEPPLTKNIELQ